MSETQLRGVLDALDQCRTDRDAMRATVAHLREEVRQVRAELVQAQTRAVVAELRRMAERADADLAEARRWLDSATAGTTGYAAARDQVACFTYHGKALRERAYDLEARP